MRREEAVPEPAPPGWQPRSYALGVLSRAAVPHALTERVTLIGCDYPSVLAIGRRCAPATPGCVLASTRLAATAAVLIRAAPAHLATVPGYSGLRRRPASGSIAGAREFPACALLRRRIGQARIPGRRDRDVRPSISATDSSSSVTDTSRTRMSAVSVCIEEATPCLQKFLSVHPHQP